MNSGRIPGAVAMALREAVDSLKLLATDMRLSGPQPRQLALIARMRDSMATVEWVIRYDAAAWDHNDEAAAS